MLAIHEHTIVIGDWVLAAEGGRFKFGYVFSILGQGKTLAVRTKTGNLFIARGSAVLIPCLPAHIATTAYTDTVTFGKDMFGNAVTPQNVLLLAAGGSRIVVTIFCEYFEQTPRGVYRIPNKIEQLHDVVEV